MLCPLCQDTNEDVGLAYQTSDPVTSLVTVSARQPKKQLGGWDWAPSDRFALMSVFCNTTQTTKRNYDVGSINPWRLLTI